MQGSPKENEKIQAARARGCAENELKVRLSMRQECKDFHRNARGCAENELRVRLSMEARMQGLPKRNRKDFRATHARGCAENELRVRLSMGARIQEFP